ncbi:MAG: DUF2780 domain-containing protein [Pseudomonadota bacterium]
MRFVTVLAGFALLVTAFTFPMKSAHADVSALLGSLTSQLGVTEEQAAGGAGSIFNVAKDSLGAGDFDSIASALPGITGLMDSAPNSGGGSSSGLLDQGASLLGGSDSTAGGLASLAGPFSDLGLSPEMINQFVPIVLEYANSEGGQQVMSLLQSALF